MIVPPPRRAPSLARRVVEGLAALVGIVGALLFVIAPLFTGPRAPAVERAANAARPAPAAPARGAASATAPPSTPPSAPRERPPTSR